MKKTTSKKIIIIVIIVLVLLIGGTYAWLSITINTNTVNVLRADNLSLTIDESASEGINLDNAIPVRDSVGLETIAYTFKLKNTGTASSDYTIYLDDLDLDVEMTRMQDKFIKYSLTVDDEDATTALLTTIGSNPNRILDSGTITADTTKSYTLRLWINQDATNEVMNTTFKGQLRIEATQIASTTSYDYTNKNIKAAYIYDEVNDETKCIIGEEATCKQISLTNTDSNIKMGTIIKYAVNDTEDKFFYVLHDDGATMTLQQRENIIKNIFWHENGSNLQGPLTTLSQLESETSTWKNVNDQTYEMGTTMFKANAFTGCNTYDSCEMNKYTLTSRTVKARMITIQEATATGCDGSNSSCPDFMHNYLHSSTLYGGSINDDTYVESNKYNNAYWTMSAYSPSSTDVWLVDRTGSLITRATTIDSGGARAVVVVSK